MPGRINIHGKRFFVVSTFTASSAMVSIVFALLLFGYATCSPLVEEVFDESAMLNPNLFEGDILGFDPEGDRNAMTTLSKRWPNGVIPYNITEYLQSVRGSVIRSAMKHIQEKTCISFRPVTPNDEYHLHFFAGKGCYTYVGRTFKTQPISLGQGCGLHSIAVHEIMHAIGFYHEHSRSDRDDYINIHYENVKPEAVPQFRKLLPNQNTLYNKFDFDSIMLYSENAFSKDGVSKTMTSKIPGKSIPNVYKKPGLSEGDIYRIKRLYEC